MEEREISGGGAICWSMGARLAILGTRGFFELPVQRVKNSCQIEYLIQRLGQVEPTVGWVEQTVGSLLWPSSRCA